MARSTQVFLNVLGQFLVEFPVAQGCVEVLLRQDGAGLLVPVFSGDAHAGDVVAEVGMESDLAGGCGDEAYRLSP